MRAELVLRRRNTVVCRIVPGERKLLGRAPAADVTLGHPSVSRLHARITWPEDRARPVIEDLHSANGVSVDGRRIAQLAELRDGCVLELGTFDMSAELVENRAPALLEDSGTVQVRLFSEVGPQLEGTLRGADAVRDLLLDLEARRRTGTLVLAERGQITFARGRVVDASTEDGRRGLQALRALAAEPRATTFRFDLDITPRESRLNVSVRSTLEEARAATERMGRDVRGIAS
jgi:pSer/pThr/pTyr-binding forkhead associated (FHA) protein